MKPIVILTERQLAEKWLPITLRELKESQKQSGVKKYSGDMMDPVGQIFGDLTIVSLIQIRMPIYTRYSDMGVGRGVTVGSRYGLGDAAFFLGRNEKGQLHRYSRSAKPVWNKPTTHQARRLSELVIQNLGHSAVQIVQEGLSTDLEFKI